MRNFHRLASNVLVLPLLHAVHRQPELWDQHKIRTAHVGSAHFECSDILLRFPSRGIQDVSVIDVLEAEAYPAWNLLPQARSLVNALMQMTEGLRLGKVIITRLPSGKVITPHIDGGEAARYYDRYQVALQCLPGNVFQIGEESVAFETGDVWHINNLVKHSVINNSDDDRIVMIVDIRTRG